MSENRIKAQLKNWNLYIRRVREYFDQKGFLEVNTPTLVTSPGSEPFLDFFETQEVIGSSVTKKFLPASPEISLKKLLSLDVGSIYEIRTSFRNKERSALHRTEFFILEWYSVGLNLEGMILQSFEFLKCLASNRPQSFRSEPNCLSVQKLFNLIYNFNLSPETSAHELLSLAQHHRLSVDISWSFDDLFHLLMLEKIEPYLKSQGLVFVTYYPPSQAALAKLNAQGWAERFEIYLNGVELANAYCELINAEEQLRRHEADNKKRRTLGRPEVPVDLEFVAALKKGLPNPVSGIALGLERYHMILSDEETIHFWSPLWRSELI